TYSQLQTSHHLFFFTDAPPTDIYTLSLHDALPIFARRAAARVDHRSRRRRGGPRLAAPLRGPHRSPRERGREGGDSRRGRTRRRDRKSTRLNSSHVAISYAVFCLKKKSKIAHPPTP